MSWGLVLSGGGALGLANIGIWEVLEREKLRPDVIAGSSMGAIIGALAAMDVPVETMKKLGGEIRISRIATFSELFFRSSLHSGFLRQRIERIVLPVIGNACIGDCRIPFLCVAGRVKEPLRWENMLTSGFMDHAMEAVERYVFPPETRIIDAIMASSAIPVIFSPVVINGDECIDLLNFGVIPARTMREFAKPDMVIATDTAPYLTTFTRPFFPKELVAFIEAGQASIKESLAACDLVIRPELPRRQLFRYDKAASFIDAGRKEAERMLPEIRIFLTSHPPASSRPQMPEAHEWPVHSAPCG